MGFAAVRGERGARAGWSIVVFAAAAFATFFSRHSIYMHWRFETRAFDLANYEQAFWTTLHGHPFRTTYLDGNTFLGNHFSPALVLPMACYALVPRAETLLVFQAVSIAAASLPLFALALARLDDPRVATLLALAYLMLPATELPLFYDYHDVSMLPFAALTLLWGIETRRPRAALLAAILTVTCKEEGALVCAGVLAFAMLDGKLALRHSALIAALVAYYAVVKVAVMPWLAGGRVVHSYYYEGSFAERFLAPAKLVHFVRLFAPLLFLPLFTSRNLVMLATPLAIVFLATRWALFDFTFQYNDYLLPFLFAGTAVTLERWRSSRVRLVLAVTILVLASIENRIYGPLLERQATRIRFDEPLRYDFTKEDAARYERINEVLRRIPPNASVAASETLGPQLARRERLYRSGEPHEGVDVYVVWALDHPALPGDGYERAFQSSELVVWTRRELAAAKWFDGAPGRDPQFRIVSAVQDWGDPQLDREVEGRPLRVAGIVHDHGYGSHAGARIRLSLVRPARSLSGAVGMDDGVAKAGHAVFVVKTTEGRELYRSAELSTGMPPQPFRVDLTGLSEIVFAVEPGADGNIDSAHADWLDLRLE